MTMNCGRAPVALRLIAGESDFQATGFNSRIFSCVGWYPTSAVGANVWVVDRGPMGTLQSFGIGAPNRRLVPLIEAVISRFL